MLAAFPDYTKEELEQHEYRMSVNNYLGILEKFLNFYAAKTPDKYKIVNSEKQAGKTKALLICKRYFNLISYIFIYLLLNQ